jgi:hypothetical protein
MTPSLAYGIWGFLRYCGVEINLVPSYPPPDPAPTRMPVASVLLGSGLMPLAQLSPNWRPILHDKRASRLGDHGLAERARRD